MQRLKAEFGNTYWYYLNFISPYGDKIIRELICKDMKTIYILLITVLSWSLQACTRPMRQTGCLHGQYSPYISRLCGSHIPAEYCTSQFQDRGERGCLQTEIGTGRRRTSSTQARIRKRDYTDKGNGRNFQKPREKKYSSASPPAEGGKWTRYADIKDTISNEPIDEYLVYRLLYPGYELWNEMGFTRET